MRNLRRSKKGQFSVISALLVSVILIMAVISMYSMVRYTSLNDSPKVLNGIGEMNNDIKRILDFTVGYYGSILTVTGNSTYAKELTTSYLSSGLVNIARSHPEWNPSFELVNQTFSTSWFMPNSYSTGSIKITYSLEELGINGITYETSSALNVEMLNSSLGVAQIKVTRDNSEPELGLSKENFWFYNYTYDDLTWDLVNPTDVLIASNGEYTITLPEGINQDAYSVQIEDNRGIIVPAFYSYESVVSDSKIPHYTYTFNWESTGMKTIYDLLDTDTFAIELLQNGTLKWLGQHLEITSNERPIPPVCIKAFRVNATIGDNNQEIPFQVEDWASDYMVPLGLAGNDSIFSNNNMLVFLVNGDVSDVTVWWDGNDTAIQTPYAWQNFYFNDKPAYTSSYGLLNNSRIEMYVHNFWIESKVVGQLTSSTAEFLRVNGEKPQYGDQLSYVIYNGTVRDIVQQEPEWNGGVSETLYVNGHDGTSTSWSKSGSLPYLHDSDSSYISDDDNYDTEGWFSFEDMTAVTSPARVSVQFECRSDGDEYFDFQVYNGTHTFGPYTVGPPRNYGWINVDLSDILDTVTEVNNAKIQVRYRYASGSSSRVYIRRVRLDVVTCPNVYSQIVLTLPANATYYTYSLRTLFVDSSAVNGIRTLNDLSVLQLSVDPAGSSTGVCITEDGIEPTDLPIVSYLEDAYNSSINWEHHWSEFITSNNGAGVMFTDRSNSMLYTFDSVAGTVTGSLVVEKQSSNIIGYIEVNPVHLAPAQFDYPLDVTWYGAVVTFDDEPIYPTSGNVGLWVMAEHPPSVSLD